MPDVEIEWLEPEEDGGAVFRLIPLKSPPDSLITIIDAMRWRLFLDSLPKVVGTFEGFKEKSL